MTTTALVVATLALAAAACAFITLRIRQRHVEEWLRAQLTISHGRLAAAEARADNLATELSTARDQAHANHEQMTHQLTTAIAHQHDALSATQQRLAAAEARADNLATEQAAARDQTDANHEQLTQQLTAGIARVQDALSSEVAAQVAAASEPFELLED